MDNLSATAEAFIPENYKGKANDLQDTVEGTDREHALKIFKRACMRLQNVQLWHKLCGPLSASFKLVAEDGSPEDRLVQLHDYFLVNIPGPGMQEGFGYDWVQVEEIKESFDPEGEKELFAMRIAACENPATANEETAHFFQKGASSTFIIERNGNSITASYHGRNEVPNTDVSRITDKIRNTIVAVGAYGGLSELQWLSLIKSFLQEEVGG
ncbi:MAG: hypothetical protein JWQ27_733 [Ferruginibacter sp.]|nr:hypothetical protein [Ferruginibacter sp.]